MCNLVSIDGWKLTSELSEALRKMILILKIRRIAVFVPMTCTIHSDNDRYLIVDETQPCKEDELWMSVDRLKFR